MASRDSGPAIIEFLPDLTTKKKKGVHRPIYAKVFTKEIITGDDVKVVHLMVNPFSGKKQGEKIAKQAKQMFERQSIEVKIHLSTFSGELIELAAGLTTNETDVVAVVGGDGSLSEVITGLMQAKSQCRVGLIPAGTGSNAYQSMNPSLPDAPEVSELGFMASTSEDSEDEALPNPAQWLAMLGDENEEGDE